MIVSHEPWMSPVICLGPDGKQLSGDAENHNIYLLTLEEIQRYDCGVIGNPQFPVQKNFSAVKPTLSEVVRAVDAYCTMHARALPEFNIELKSREAWYDTFVPQPEVFVRTVLTGIAELGIESRTTLQSFDLNVLRELKKQIRHDIRISYLVERNYNIENALEQLGFQPDVYSPHYWLVKKETVEFAHAQGIRVIPWTVNTADEFRKLIEIGVDGIITDYPNLIESVTTE
jgi:glycerophosphoryl diester phosphodiesterase